MSARKPQSDQLSAGRNLARPTAAKRYFVGAKVNTSGVRSLLFRGNSRQAQGGPAVALKTLAEKFGVYAECEPKASPRPGCGIARSSLPHGPASQRRRTKLRGICFRTGSLSQPLLGVSGKLRGWDRTGATPAEPSQGSGTQRDSRAVPFVWANNSPAATNAPSDFWN